MLSSLYNKLPLVGWYIEGDYVKECRTNIAIGQFRHIKEGWAVAWRWDGREFTGQTKETAMQAFRNYIETTR